MGPVHTLMPPSSPVDLHLVQLKLPRTAEVSANFAVVVCISQCEQYALNGQLLVVGLVLRSPPVVYLHLWMDPQNERKGGEVAHQSPPRPRTRRPVVLEVAAVKPAAVVLVGNAWQQHL